MLFAWDEAKCKRNIVKDGVDFALVEEMDWARALRLKDKRQPYGEERYIAFGLIGERLYGLRLYGQGRKKTHHQLAQSQFTRD